MDHVPGMGETDDYQEKGDYSQYPTSVHFQGSLKPPKRTMSAYACFSRKV